jgi:hypothetical protein
MSRGIIEDIAGILNELDTSITNETTIREIAEALIEVDILEGDGP